MPRRRKTRRHGQRKNKRVRRGTRNKRSKRSKRGGFWKKKCFIASQCDAGQICLHDGLPHFATYGIGSGVCVTGSSPSSGVTGKKKSSSCVIS